MCRAWSSPTDGRRVRGGFLLAALLSASSCAGTGPPPELLDPSSVDPASTAALWRLDEPLTEDAMHDSGPYGLHGTAGPEVQADHGRVGGGRVFNGKLESFIYVPYSAALDTMGTIVVEAYVKADAEDRNPVQTIAARWGAMPEFQSWILFFSDEVAPPSRSVEPVAGTNPPGRLVFVLQTNKSPVPQAFAATDFQPWRSHTWNHVAVSVDGSSVRFYVNGRLESSYPCFGRVRASRAPLTIGNFLDATYDTGEMVWYRGFEGTGFSGMIDEVRISTIERARAWETAEP
jgi:hypothetical protein